MIDDHELLAQYVRTRSEAAFASLVARYVNLVHSAAMRFTRNPHHAEEITQAVFLILARKAGKLSRNTVLSGWLYQTARLTAANFIKGEVRRHHREQEACMQSTLNQPSAAAWEQIAPLLDDAMGRLGQTDRNSIVLRFFENKTTREVAAALNVNEAAAQKRVSRAVEKLRKFFTKSGVSLSAAALGAAIAGNSVQAAPAALAATISAAIVKGAVVAASVTTLVNGTIKAIFMTTIQKTLIVATIAAGVGAGIYEGHKASALQTQVQALQQQQAPLAEQVQNLQKERDDATARLEAMAAQILKNNSSNSELLRLRAQVAALRQQTNALTASKTPEARRASTNPQVANPPPNKIQQEYYSREQISFSGYSEPELAFKSIVWWSLQGDTNEMLNGMSPAMRVPAEQALKNMSESQLAATKTRMQNITGYRLMDMEVQSNDKVAYNIATLYSDGREVKEKIFFKRIGNEWKASAPNE